MLHGSGTGKSAADSEAAFREEIKCSGRAAIAYATESTVAVAGESQSGAATSARMDLLMIEALVMAVFIRLN